MKLILIHVFLVFGARYSAGHGPNFPSHSLDLNINIFIFSPFTWHTYYEFSIKTLLSNKGPRCSLPVSVSTCTVTKAGKRKKLSRQLSVRVTAEFCFQNWSATHFITFPDSGRFHQLSLTHTLTHTHFLSTRSLSLFFSLSLCLFSSHSLSHSFYLSPSLSFRCLYLFLFQSRPSSASLSLFNLAHFL